MRRKKKSIRWSQAEVEILPNYWENYLKGELHDNEIRAMFQNRSIGAIRVRYDIVKGGKDLHGKNIKAANYKVQADKARLATESMLRELRELRVVHGDRIVTYREVVAA